MTNTHTPPYWPVVPRCAFIGCDLANAGQGFGLCVLHAANPILAVGWRARVQEDRERKAREARDRRNARERARREAS